MKKHTITIEFDANEIDQLVDMSMANFIYQQKKRFSLYAADKGFVDHDKRGSMKYFERFMELKIYQSVMKSDGNKTAIYTDNADNACPWILIVYKERAKK